MNKLILLALLASTLASCTDVIEEDLDGFGLVLLTPPAGHTSTGNQVDFRWEAVPNATRYHIQVCTPDFTAPISYALDSVVTEVYFSGLFDPGTFTWRVRAENDNSHTDWYTRTFSITSSQTLTGQVPQLLLPADDLITNMSVITFTWDTLPFTVDHRFELRANSSTGTLLQALITPENTITLNNLADGEYAWGVQAQNDVPSSSDFAYRSFIVDATAPSVPIQLVPSSGAIVDQAPFTFLWQSGQDALTSTHDSLIVRNAAQQIVRALGNASGTYADSLGLGTYTWYVKTVDQAGNSSLAGPLTFSVQ